MLSTLAFNHHRAAREIPEVDPHAMSTSHILQHLYSLDTSSPGISRHMYGLIRRDEEEQYLSSLQGSELVRLVDFLDEVRTYRFRLVSGYGIDSAGSRCHSHNRRCFSTMLAQTTSYLRSPHDPAILIRLRRPCAGR